MGHYMNTPLRILGLALASLAVVSAASGADWRDLLRPKTSGSNSAATSVLSLGSLSEEQITQGLKEALAKGVQNSITNLGRSGGYLSNLNVRIPMPEKLAKIERTARMLKQDHLADEFIATMNRAAEAAVPEAAAVFSDAIRNMTLEDARALVKGPEDAATQYFKKTGEARIQEKMLPIVKQATDKAGVTASYKKLTANAAPALSFLGGSSTDLDVDRYVAQKASDGLFKMIAEEEKRIRQNPAARTTDLLKKVFGAK